MNKNTYIFILVAVIILAVLGMWQFKNREGYKEADNINEKSADQESFSLNDDSVDAINKDLEEFQINDTDFSETDAEIDSLGR